MSSTPHIIHLPIKYLLTERAATCLSLDLTLSYVPSVTFGGNLHATSSIVTTKKTPPKGLPYSFLIPYSSGITGTYSCSTCPPCQKHQALICVVESVSVGALGSDSLGFQYGFSHLLAVCSW